MLQENQAYRVIRFAIFIAAYLSHPLIMKFQYVYSSVMVFNNGLQGPPGITGIKGEVSVLSFINTHIIGVLGCIRPKKKKNLIHL